MLFSLSGLDPAGWYLQHNNGCGFKRFWVFHTLHVNLPKKSEGETDLKFSLVSSELFL